MEKEEVRLDMPFEEAEIEEGFICWPSGIVKFSCVMRVFQLVCLCILAWSVCSFSKYPAESVQYGKTVKKEWKEYLSNGGYRLHTEYADGSVKILTATPCHWCEGKGYCKECGGAGENIVTSYGKEISKPCPLCHGVRLCPYCEGKLYLFETVWKQPVE